MIQIATKLVSGLALIAHRHPVLTQLTIAALFFAVIALMVTGAASLILHPTLPKLCVFFALVLATLLWTAERRR